MREHLRMEIKWPQGNILELGDLSCGERKHILRAR